MRRAREEVGAGAGLLTGAIVWGLVWYPYRILAEAGVSGLVATTLTYLVAAAGLLPLWWRVRRPVPRIGLLVLIGLSAAVCNLGYVLAMLAGEVMRVLLLFYLSPLWTVALARLLLGERVDRAGAAVMALAFAGAVAMLWRPAAGWPLPAVAAEWIGLAAGFFFALTNVLARKLQDLPIETKSLAVFAGVVALGALALGVAPAPAAALPTAPAWGLIVLVGLVLLSVNFAVLHGLAHMPANRAIVIFLFELVVAAVSSWLLAGEAMGAREWLGATMIVAASLFSGRVGRPAR